MASGNNLGRGEEEPQTEQLMYKRCFNSQEEGGYGEYFRMDLP